MQIKTRAGLIYLSINSVNTKLTRSWILHHFEYHPLPHGLFIMPVFSHFQFCLVLENQLSPTHTYIYIYKLQEKQKSFHNVVKKHHQKFLTKSNRPEVFCKKGALKNFAKFTGKHLCWSLLFKKLNTSGCIFKTFFIEHLRWLFLADIKNPKFQNK